MNRDIRIVGKVAVITATADFHPLRNLSKIAEQLESLDFEGSVLFDLLSVNGLSENRFASMDFNGQSFDRKSFCVEHQISSALLGEQDALIRSTPYMLEGSVLSSKEVKEFFH